MRIPIDKMFDHACKKCGCCDFGFLSKGNQLGIYCSRCGRWLKWADEDEQNLAMKQEPVLDKIRAEIEQTVSRYTISRERGCTGQVEWSDRLIKESEVLQIIDKYKTESEE